MAENPKPVDAAAAAAPRHRPTRIDVGFLDDCEPYLLTNRYFPSKVGGKPAWLELSNIPNAEQLQCPKCNQTMVFFLQIYASNDGTEQAFHRSLYVFVCKQSVCWELNCSKPIVAFRSQLPRNNPYYSYEAPDDEVKEPPIASPVPICDFCNIAGRFPCDKCQAVYYCTEEHRERCLAEHQAVCGGPKAPPADELVGDNHPFLLPEYELVIEGDTRHEQNDSSDEGASADGDEDTDSEDDGDDDTDENGERAEKRRREEAARLIAAGQNGEMAGVEESELLRFALGDTDKGFAHFRKTIDQDQEQVVRYNRHGRPLWISSKNRLAAADVPACPCCGGARSFEFQIMPQMLNTIKDEAFDWGIIAVYTCAASCNIQGSYVPEFCYKQDLM